METPAVALKANASVIPMRNTTLDHGDPRRSCVDKTTMVSSKRSNIWGTQLGTRFRNKGRIIKGVKKETTSSLLSSHFHRDNLTFHGRIFDQEADPKKVAAIVLGGGAGTRLFPLTERRAKPAVPIGGCYRLIDIPMNNCINSGVKKIYVLTQFNSESLNRYLSRTYNFGSCVNFGDGFVEVLAATQTPGEAGMNWFQGTADAVRKFIWIFEDIKNRKHEHIRILSGDLLI